MGDWMQWISEHAGHLLGSTPGVGLAAVALVRARATKVEADAKVQRALADALDGMRGDLAQARSMAAEALSKAAACERDRSDCDRRCDALGEEMAEMRLMMAAGGRR
jgi:hypothetical protein